ncbi:MAG: hypothetical protein ABFC57_15595 [Veillonellales bacterium]
MTRRNQLAKKRERYAAHANNSSYWHEPGGERSRFFLYKQRRKKDFEHCVRIFIMVEVENRNRSGKQEAVNEWQITNALYHYCR